MGAAAKDDAVPRADEVGGGGRNEDEAASESDEVSVISIGWMVLAEPTVRGLDVAFELRVIVRSRCCVGEETGIYKC